MTVQKRGERDSTKNSRDPDFAGAEVALRRAAVIARRRAIETSGAVAVFRDGKIVQDNGPAELPVEEIETQGGCRIGALHVTVGIRNPAEPDRVWEGLFLVETGATGCLVPRQHLESIGLAPKGQRAYELADGSEIRMGVTVAQVEFMGEFVGATIAFGEPDAEPLLGVTALESAGIEVDPRNQTLRRLPAVRLKESR